MSHLAGKFAGILRAELPPDKVQAALAALAALESRGLKVIAEAASPDDKGAADEAGPGTVGLASSGDVREISQLFAAAAFNVDGPLLTNRSSAPMPGDLLFEAGTRARSGEHRPPSPAMGRHAWRRPGRRGEAGGTATTDRADSLFERWLIAGFRTPRPWRRPSAS